MPKYKNAKVDPGDKDQKPKEEEPEPKVDETVPPVPEPCMSPEMTYLNRFRTHKLRTHILNDNRTTKMTQSLMREMQRFLKNKRVNTSTSRIEMVTYLESQDPSYFTKCSLDYSRPYT